MLHGRYRGIFLIEDFIVRWISEERATGKTPEFRNWAWKTSYVMGMLTVELVMGGMSQVDPLTDEIIDKIAAGAKYNFKTPSGIDPWDAEGFKAGVKDMLVDKMTADSIKEFVTSGRMKVSHGDFKVIYKELGGDTPTGTVSGSIIFSP
jgi:hypothetical protein